MSQLSWVKSNVTVQDNTQQNSLEWSIIVGGLVKIFIFKSFCAIKSRRETSCYSLNYMLPGACYPDVTENLTRAFEFWASAPRVTGKIMCLELLIDWLRKIIRLLVSSLSRFLFKKYICNWRWRKYLFQVFFFFVSDTSLCPNSVISKILIFRRFNTI